MVPRFHLPALLCAGYIEKLQNIHILNNAYIFNNAAIDIISNTFCWLNPNSICGGSKNDEAFWKKIGSAPLGFEGLIRAKQVKSKKEETVINIHFPSANHLLIIYRNYNVLGRFYEYFFYYTGKVQWPQVSHGWCRSHPRPLLEEWTWDRKHRRLCWRGIIHFNNIFFLFKKKIKANCGAGVTVNATSIGFDPHSRKWNIYLNLYFHFFALVSR